MENRYSLFIYPKAEQDMERIFEYIAKDLYAPESALNLINKFYAALENIRYFPQSCPLTSNIALKEKNIRKLCVENYIIFYRTNQFKKQIEVARVLYGMSNWVGIL